MATKETTKIWPLFSTALVYTVEYIVNRKQSLPVNWLYCTGWTKSHLLHQMYSRTMTTTTMDNHNNSNGHKNKNYFYIPERWKWPCGRPRVCVNNSSPVPLPLLIRSIIHQSTAAHESAPRNYGRVNRPPSIPCSFLTIMLMVLIFLLRSPATHNQHPIQLTRCVESLDRTNPTTVHNSLCVRLLLTRECVYSFHYYYSFSAPLLNSKWGGPWAVILHSRNMLRPSSNPF